MISWKQISKEETVSRYNASFNNRVVSEPPIFDTLYSLAPKDSRTRWLIAMINNNPHIAMNKLEQLKYKVDNHKAVVSTILEKAGQLQPVTERKDLYSVCNKMRCANDPALKEKLISYIKVHLRDPNPNAQSVGLETFQGAEYLSQTQQRDITTEIVEWLCKQEASSANQPSSAQIPLLTWVYLTKRL